MDANTASMGSLPFDAQTQVVNLTASDGLSQIPVSLADVDYLYLKIFFPAIISFSTQIGASFITLLVVLLMTPRSRFKKWATILNIASMVICVIRTTLLVCEFPTSVFKFYGQFTGDATYVNMSDLLISVAVGPFNILQIILIEAALIIQAWTMVQLWQPIWKWPSLVVSAIFALLTVGFKCATTVIQTRAILAFDNSSLSPLLWVREADLSIGTANIVWFCLIFITRLVMHMWVNRSLLHTSKGLSAMDALVITNGFLMLVPTLFAGLQWNVSADGVDWEAGSFVYTTVVCFLPLGSLIAQRLAASPSYGAASLGQSGSNRTAKASTGASTGKRHFLPTFSHRSDCGSNQVSVQAGSRLSSQDEKNVDQDDLELQRIDDADDLGHNVRVDREVELLHEPGA